MQQLRIAVVGYGNIGKYAVEAVQEAPDMELAGVVRRTNPAQEQPAELAQVQVVDDIALLGKVDVAILCGPTRSVGEQAAQMAALGIHTVDSFDIHGQPLWTYRQAQDAVCKAQGTASIISAGWDPGSDSVLRTLMLAMAPKGITYTNFGPGMSMGHTVAVKSKAGVRNALSMTIPTGTGVHRRMVYVELEEGAKLAEVEQAIKTDDYFVKDHTVVTAVPCVNDLIDMGHATHIERKGVSGRTQNQKFEFRMTINNPALTSQIMVACARAVARQRPGCYTMPEIAPMDLLPGSREDLVKALV